MLVNYYIAMPKESQATFVGTSEDDVAAVARAAGFREFDVSTVRYTPKLMAEFGSATPMSEVVTFREMHMERALVAYGRPTRHD